MKGLYGQNIDWPYINVMLHSWMLCSIYQQANIFIKNWRCRWRGGNDFAKPEVMSLRTQAPRKSKGFPWIQNGVSWSLNLVPRYRKVFHGIKYIDYQSTAITKRRGYPVRFFRVLCWHDGRIQKNFKVHMTRNFLLAHLEELSKWWRMAFILL